jgi:hypothetical protein
MMILINISLGSNASLTNFNSIELSVSDVNNLLVCVFVSRCLEQVDMLVVETVDCMYSSDNEN